MFMTPLKITDNKKNDESFLLIHPKYCKNNYCNIKVLNYGNQLEMIAI